jgi:hypothetical protein
MRLRRQRCVGTLGMTEWLTTGHYSSCIDLQFQRDVQDVFLRRVHS